MSLNIFPIPNMTESSHEYRIQSDFSNKFKDPKAKFSNKFKRNDVAAVRKQKNNYTSKFDYYKNHLFTGLGTIILVVVVFYGLKLYKKKDLSRHDLLIDLICLPGGAAIFLFNVLNISYESIELVRGHGYVNPRGPASTSLDGFYYYEIGHIIGACFGLFLIVIGLYFQKLRLK